MAAAFAAGLAVAFAAGLAAAFAAGLAAAFAAGLAAAFAAGLTAAFAAGFAAAFATGLAFATAGFSVVSGDALVAVASVRAAAADVAAAPVSAAPLDADVVPFAEPEFVSRQPSHKIIATIIATIRPIKMTPSTLYANAKSATAAARRPKIAEIAIIPFRFGAISVIVFILPEGAQHSPRFTHLFRCFSTMVTAIAQSSDVTINKIVRTIEACCDPNTPFCGSLCRNCPI